MSIDSLTSIHTVTVKEPLVTKSASGAPVRSYASVRDLSCRVMPVTSRESLQYAVKGISITHRVFFAADPELSASSLLVYGIRELEVSAVRNPSELGMYWLAECRESSHTQP